MEESWRWGGGVGGVCRRYGGPGHSGVVVKPKSSVLLRWVGWGGGGARLSLRALCRTSGLYCTQRGEAPPPAVPVPVPVPPPPAGLSEKGTLLAVTGNIGSPLNRARNYTSGLFVSLEVGCLK